jgi:hypothetical protein
VLYGEILVISVRYIFRTLIVSALAVALVGCVQKPTGPQRAAVHGKVTLDGKPITAGQISLVPITPGAGPAWGTVVKDGQYASTATGPVVGKSKVEIRASGNRAATSESGDWKSNYVELIPARYNAQSTLEVDVRPGDNTFDFQLKSQ